MDAARTAIPEADHASVETAIAACVEDFYAKARKDPLLGPVFNAAVADWDVHLRIVAISGRTRF
jgi:hemoglobin